MLLNHKKSIVLEWTLRKQNIPPMFPISNLNKWGRMRADVMLTDAIVQYGCVMDEFFAELRGITTTVIFIYRYFMRLDYVEILSLNLHSHYIRESVATNTMVV